MATKEVCFLVGRKGEILWSDTNDDPGYLVDRQDRWEAIWENREHLPIIAHSHPFGPNDFSSEDRSTEDAIRNALGDRLSRRLSFIVVTPTETIVSFPREAKEPFWIVKFTTEVIPEYTRLWIAELRSRSGMEITNEERK